jgi:hypothetical protein
MTFWSKIRSVIKYCIYLSILSILVALAALSVYIGPTLYKEYKSDSPWDVNAPTVQAQLDGFLQPDQFNVFPLTTYNFDNMLGLSDDLEWMDNYLRHS